MEKLRPERESLINGQLTQLSRTFGTKRAIDTGSMLSQYRQRSYPGLVREVRNSFGMQALQVTIRYAEHLGDERKLATIEMTEQMPPLAAFLVVRPKVRLNLAMRRIRAASFHTTLRILSHELAHVILRAENHPLKESEFATDLTAMLLGYHVIYAACYSKEELAASLGFPTMLPEVANLMAAVWKESWDEEHLNPDYMTATEIRYAAEVIRRCVL